MPRIRTVKPEFFTHPEITALSIPARLLMASLFTQADDEGRLYDQPLLIRAQAFSESDDVNITDLLDELSRGDRITRYVAKGRACMQIVNFNKHQRILRPTKSSIPKLARVRANAAKRTSTKAAKSQVKAAIDSRANKGVSARGARADVKGSPREGRARTLVTSARGKGRERKGSKNAPNPTSGESRVPKNSRAHGTNPRAVAARERADELRVLLDKCLECGDREGFSCPSCASLRIELEEAEIAGGLR